MDTKSMKDFILNYYDKFFYKQISKTSHETLANYANGNLIPGGTNDEIVGCYYTHINYHTMKRALVELVSNNKNNTDFIIVETGCAAHGTKSTLLWDKFVNYFGGKVFSVDLNNNAVEETNRLTSDKTTVTCSDSLLFLPTLIDRIDFLYLDSYDVDFLNPILSTGHHLKEFMCIKHLLHKNSIILIDDTPCSPEWLDNGKFNNIYKEYKKTFDNKMSGKGSLVNIELELLNSEKLLHQYQVLWKYNTESKKEFDIVIPVGPNDIDIIKKQIKYTQQNVIGYRNIYLISYDPSLQIDNCITIDEKIFPFSIKTVEKFHNKLPRNGWYLQQLLKLYAGFIIPDILDKYLVIDSDTFFCKPTIFIMDNKCLYNYGFEYHIPYFIHMKKLHNTLNRVDNNKSGICHHMIFETKYIKKLFDLVENENNDKFYNLFLNNVTLYNGSVV